MFTHSKITVISAHPDDWEIGMGQFLLELLNPARNNRLEICVVTEGAAGGFANARKAEQAAVTRSLKKRFAVEVTSAARLAEAMCFPMSGSRLCPEPVRVTSHAQLES